MIKYNPVAGLTIIEAISKAVQKARASNDLVEANINDVILYITPNSKVEKYYTLYKKHLEQKYKRISQKVR